MGTYTIHGGTSVADLAEARGRSLGSVLRGSGPGSYYVYRAIVALSAGEAKAIEEAFATEGGKAVEIDGRSFFFFPCRGGDGFIKA